MFVYSNCRLYTKHVYSNTYNRYMYVTSVRVPKTISIHICILVCIGIIYTINEMYNLKKILTPKISHIHIFNTCNYYAIPQLMYICRLYIGEPDRAII